jgi:SIR2-like domain
MLMVIFGAGASYDSWSSYPPNVSPLDDGNLRLPLANQLFLSIPSFRVISQKYPPCQPLLPYLESHSNIEQELEKFREQSGSDPVCARQLLALQYYIRDVIRECESRWSARTHGVSNYKTLLDQIRKHPDLCFVTFNYDTLLETALAGLGVQIPNIAGYVSEPKCALFKLHGSTNWERRVPANKTTLYAASSEPQEKDLLDSSPVFDDSSFVRKIGDPHSGESMTQRYYSYPALAIPTAAKSTFVCPPEHVRVLTECIPKVTRILIVGWRAAEQHFLQMLATGLSKPVRVMAVCEKPDASTETLDRLKPIAPPGSTLLAARGGFTDFVKERESEWLLK